VVGEERAHLLAEVGTDQVRQVGAEHDPEAAVADVPAQHPLGAGIEVAPGGDHGGRRARLGVSAVAADRQYGGGAVPEERARHQVLR
jgi:hypothetical protein